MTTWSQAHAARACCCRSYVALSLVGLLAITAVSAQPFKFTPATYQPELTEAAQRVASNFTGFVFNFANATVRLDQLERLPQCCFFALKAFPAA